MFALAYMGRKRWAQPNNRLKIHPNHKSPSVPHPRFPVEVDRFSRDVEYHHYLSATPLCWDGIKRSLGSARRFRPTYAGANVGHPSDFLSPWLGGLRLSPLRRAIGTLGQQAVFLQL
jgi:hypothetical protein